MTQGPILMEALRVALRLETADPHRLRQLVQGDQPNALVSVAEHHGLLPALHVALRDVDGLSAEVLAATTSGYHLGVRTHLQALDGLRTLQRVLDGEMPWVVMKGPVLAGLLYTRADVRSYVDLDVVVPPGRFRDAVEALEAAGCRLADRNWDRLRSQMPGELRVMLPSGLWIDLHWHLLNQPSQRSAFRLDADALLERSRVVALPGLADPVRTLDPADTFLHLGLHACLAGGDRLSWAADLHQAVQHDAPPWDDVVTRARGQGTGLAVGVMVRRADAALPLGVPNEVLQELAPSRGWAAVTGAVDRRAPLEASFGRPSASRLVLRSTRATGRASTGELLRRSVAWVAGGARRERRTLDRDPSSPSSFLYEAGGAHARSAFFELVRTAGDRQREERASGGQGAGSPASS
jgi:hypothetical protein